MSQRPSGFAVRIDNLTGIRGFAALWVVLFHANLGAPPGQGLGFFVEHGYYGVDAFFVLSGFVLSLVYAPKVPAVFSFIWYRNYLVRRLAKIYPLHILTLCASILLVWVAGHFQYRLLSEVENTPWTALCQALLLHAFGLTHDLSWNTASWSVSAEWFAYSLLFAPIVFGLRRAKTALVALLAAATWAGFLALCAFVLHHNIALSTNGILRITPEFLCGYLLYRLLEGRSLRRGDLWTALGLVLVVVVCVGDSGTAWLLMPALMALMAGLYIGGRATDMVFGNRAAVIIGDASYSIYMMQGFVFMAWHQVVRRVPWVPGRESSAPSALLVAALICAVGLLTFRFVEEPLRRAILQRFGSPSRGSEASIPTRGPAADTQVAATIS